MIWILLFFIAFFINNKELVFMNKILMMDYSSIFMVSIMPLIYLIIKMFYFSFPNNLEKKKYSMMMGSILVLVTLIFTLENIYLFFMLVEVSIFPMAYLILNFSKDSDKESALKYMFSINILGSIPFMYFLLNNFLESNLNLKILTIFSENMIIYMFFLLMLISKIPMFLFHFWLTKAHVAASGAISMILASIMLKLGTFGLYKFSIPFCSMGNFFWYYITIFSLVGFMNFNLVMIRFFDVKYLVACSSILHMSLIFPYVTAHSTEGVVSSLMMMVGHGLISFYLFFLITIKYEKNMSRTMELSKSVESNDKFMSLSLFIFLLLNLGIPPLISFYTEFIFLVVMMKVSKFMVFTFSFMMVTCVIFLMMYLTKILFGKKFIFENKESSYNLVLKSFLIFLSLLVLPLMN